MVFIINDKKYDTEKSELIMTQREFFDFTYIYRTKKGTFFEVISPFLDAKWARLISRIEVKEKLKGNYKAYVKVFGDVEEG